MAHKDSFKLHRFNPTRNNVRKQFFYNTDYSNEQNGHSESMINL